MVEMDFVLLVIRPRLKMVVCAALTDKNLTTTRGDYALDRDKNLSVRVL